MLATVVVAFTAHPLQNKFSAFKAVGGMIGTSVSAFFLFVIPLILAVSVLIYRLMGYDQTAMSDSAA